jgi:large conductance mechanosensitive channel
VLYSTPSIGDEEQSFPMSSFVREFKEFISRGNLVDLAVGFVLGISFAGVIAAFTDYVLMPIVAIPFGEPNFDSALVLTVNDAEIRFGAFLTVFVTFVLTAFVLFLIIKAYNRFRKGEATEVTSEVGLLKDIRAELRKLNEKAV